MDENMVLTKVSGPNKEEVTEGRRKLHNEELHDLYSSPDIIRMVQSKKVIWGGFVCDLLPRVVCAPPAEPAKRLLQAVCHVIDLESQFS
jgi:hypothetical protein